MFKIPLNKIFSFVCAVLVIGGNILFFNVVGVSAAGGVQAPVGGGCPPGQLCNPLKVNTIQDFLIAIIEILIQFAIPIIILFIMYAGYLFVTARGDAGQIEKARSALMWAVVGGVIILAAQLIITVITGTVSALKAP